MAQSEAQRDPGLSQLERRADPDRILILLRSLTLIVFAIAAVCCVFFSLHWRMAVDTPVMHYVVFLMRHGLRPYSQITDNNMPGAYLTEAAAMTVFGGSDLAWRIYEFFLMAVLAGSATLIARRWDWVAGIFAAGLFFVLHTAEGPQVAVERELVIGVALLAACAALLESVRRSQPALMLLFGLLAGVAASIKPTYLPLPLGLLALTWFTLHRRAVHSLPYLLWAILGLALTGLLLIYFVLHEHALPGFLFILRDVLPAYTGLERPPLRFLLDRVLPHAVTLLVLLTLPLFVINGRREGHWNWERAALATTAAFGLLSYFAQGKGFLYHRYVFMIFLLLLVGAEIFDALRHPGWPRILAAVALAFALFYIVPIHLRTTRQIVGRNDLELALEGDLAHLGSRQNLQGKVQCFDLVYGCLNALYHLNLVENTGFTGDMLLFTARGSVASNYYRGLFWTLARQQPADVLVISNGNFGVENSFNKLDRWPEFQAYLRNTYVQAAERCFPYERYSYHYREPLPPGDCYRIYLRQPSTRAAQ